MRQTSRFLVILFSLFLISSCQHMGKKACCSKKDASKQGLHKDKKACCAKKHGKKSYQHKDKKACCAKKHAKSYRHKGKKYLFKWGKKDKKACCGKAEFAGFSSVKSLNKGKISGSVFFENVGRYKVKITADITGLSPNSQFGFHVHEFGTCENKGLLAGGHLNPWGGKHAGPEAKDRHLGDLGNLKSDKLGKAVYSEVVKGKLKQFMGRSLIIHAKADDMKTQPSGNSGNRIACGVIVASMPPVSEEPTETTKAPAVDKAVSSKAKAPIVDKAVSSKAKVPVVDKAVSSKAKAPIVDKAVSSKAKAPIVDKAVSSKAKAPIVDKAVSTQKVETQKASAVSSGKTENSKK